MKIKEVQAVIKGAGYIRNSPLGIMWFRGESTELNGIEVASKELFLRDSLQGRARPVAWRPSSLMVYPAYFLGRSGGVSERLINSLRYERGLLSVR